MRGPRSRAPWGGVRTKRGRSVDAELLARHYRQLRTSHGTVLLGDPVVPNATPRLAPEWFVTGCPLDADAALDALCARHGFASRAAALRALQDARADLVAAKHPDAAAFDDLPRRPRRA